MRLRLRYSSTTCTPEIYPRPRQHHEGRGVTCSFTFASHSRVAGLCTFVSVSFCDSQSRNCCRPHARAVFDVLRGGTRPIVRLRSPVRTLAVPANYPPTHCGSIWPNSQSLSDLAAAEPGLAVLPRSFCRCRDTAHRRDKIR